MTTAGLVIPSLPFYFKPPESVVKGTQKALLVEAFHHFFECHSFFQKPSCTVSCIRSRPFSLKNPPHLPWPSRPPDCRFKNSSLQISLMRLVNGLGCFHEFGEIPSRLLPDHFVKAFTGFAARLLAFSLGFGPTQAGLLSQPASNNVVAIKRKSILLHCNTNYSEAKIKQTYSFLGAELIFTRQSPPMDPGTLLHGVGDLSK